MSGRYRVGYGWAVLAAVGVGCSDGDGPKDSGTVGTGCASGGDLTVTPGTGADSYQALSSGDAVTMVHGPQGGWHIETAGLVSRSEPEVSVHPRIVVPDLDDLELVGTQDPSFLALVGYDEAACEGTFYNARGFLDTTPSASSGGPTPEGSAGPTSLSDQDFVCELRDRTLHYEIEVADILSGRVGSAATDVVAVLDPADVSVCDNIAVALGTGSVADFQPMSSGDPLVMVHGEGDSWTVDVSGRVRRSVADVTVHTRVTLPSMADLQVVGTDAPVPVTLDGYDAALGQGTFDAVPGAVDADQGSTPQDFVCSLDGVRVLLEVTVAEVGSDGALTALIEANLALDPDDAATCASL